jgi:4-carboxymuconolactone decarboxylase
MSAPAVERVPGFDPASMSEQQRQVYEAILSGPRGVVRGPVEVWLHNPGLAEHAQALGAYCRFGTALPARLSELAIIATAAFWRAGYEWRSHAPMAIEGGLDERVVEAIRTGAAPDFANEDEAAVHRFTVELLNNHRVSKPAWEAAIGLLGSHGAVDLVGILGYYALISMTINAFEIGASTDHADPFL